MSHFTLDDLLEAYKRGKTDNYPEAYNVGYENGQKTVAPLFPPPPTVTVVNDKVITHNKIRAIKFFREYFVHHALDMYPIEGTENRSPGLKCAKDFIDAFAEHFGL